MTENNIVLLHNHSSLGSLQDSIINVDDMFKKAKELGMPALSLTDHGTVAAVIDARKASIKYGVKYIPGMEGYFVNSFEEGEKRKHIVLLCKNAVGYKNLLNLNYKGFQHGKYIAIMDKLFPQIDWNLLEEHHEGLICLTACGSGLLSRLMFQYNEEKEHIPASCLDQTRAAALKLKGIFGEDLYLEVQPHDLKIFQKSRKTGEVENDKHGNPIVTTDQQVINRNMKKLGEELGIKVVATSDSHYLTKQDSATHDLLMAISSKSPLSDPNRHRYEVDEFYMKDRKTVENYFAMKFNANFANAVCDNTIEIANKCEDPVYLDTKGHRFPQFPVKDATDYEQFKTWRATQKFPATVGEDSAYFRFKCIAAFNDKYKHLNKDQRKVYTDRIMTEIKVLEGHNFASYMLIVADFINWARAQGIRVGRGRGSVCGSFTAYLLGIHQLESIQHGLIFERFHNPEKKSFPDIDTDFDPDGRDRVEQYIIEKYGAGKVAHVSNLSTMTPKVVVKDIARSLEIGGGKSEAFKIANKITDSIPADAKTLDDAMARSKDFNNFCNQYPQLYEYGRKLVGLEKVFSTHAAGIVISDVDLKDIVPLRIDKKGVVSVQFEKTRTEDVGLIKMDLLGLEYLKTIKETIRNAREIGMDCPEEPNDFNDEKTWKDLAKGHTVGVFQMQSSHMKNLCKRIKANSVEDLSLINALGRPSAEGSRDEYIDRRDGIEKVVYYHPCLEPALKDSLGVCVYEEQLIKLAYHVAGWSLGKADGLRKMTKAKEKAKELGEKLKLEFCKDAQVHSKITLEQAEFIWDGIILPFIGYGFNKSHSLAYSTNSYESAYYRTHYPAPFLAALLNAEADGNTQDKDDNIKLYRTEAKRLGIKILPPDVNKSRRGFYATDARTIFSGFNLIKGVGDSAIDNLISTREVRPFKSFGDFLHRVSSRSVRKDTIQAMAQAGCFDELGITRKSAFTYYAEIRTKAHDWAKYQKGKGVAEAFEMSDFTLHLDGLEEEWSREELLKAEKATLGELVSGDYREMYGGFFTGSGVGLDKLASMSEGQGVNIEAIIESLSENKLKSGKNAGKTYVRCQVADLNGNTASMTLWPEHWNKHKNKLAAGKAFKAICKVNLWGGAASLILDILQAVKDG